MAKVLVLCGSGNEDGYTREMCDSALSYYSSSGYDADLFVISDMDIGHCTDCGGCTQGVCVIRDDMSMIYDSFAESDLLVIATPIHFSGPSSLTKAAMDRFQMYWYNDALRHPSSCVALMCGGSRKPNFEMTENIIRAFCITVGMNYLGSLEIPDTDNGSPDLDGKVRSFLEQIRI